MRARALVIIPLLGVALLALHASLFAGYVIDDAWISFRYARHLAGGHGLAFDPGGAPVEGYTNFLWVLLATPAIALGIPVERVMAALGLACATAVVVISVRRARQTDREARLAGLPVALLLASAHGLAFHAVSGLETPLFALLLLIASLALVDRRPLPFAIATTLAFLTRPEAALLGLGGTALFALRPRAADTSRRDARVALLTFVLLVTPYLAWKLAYFGELLPNTLRAKPPGVASGMRYLARELGPYAGLVVAAVAGARARLARGDARTAELVVIALVFLGAIALEGGDWMPGSRMIVPHLAALAIAADRPIREWLRPSRERAGAARLVATLAVLAIAPWQALRSAELVRGTRARAPIDAARTELAERLESRGVRSVALLDIGLLGWRAPRVRIVDLGGLTDRAIAAAPGGHGEKRADLGYLEWLAPDVVILTSARAATFGEDGRAQLGARFAAERHLEESDWLTTRYAYVETIAPLPIYRMHVFERRATRPLTR